MAPWYEEPDETPSMKPGENPKDYMRRVAKAKGWKLPEDEPADAPIPSRQPGEEG